MKKTKTHLTDWKWNHISDVSSGPSPRHLHSSVLFNNLWFIYGGITKEGTLLSDFWKFDLATKTWNLLPPPPFGIAYCHSMVLYPKSEKNRNDKIVMIASSKDDSKMDQHIYIYTIALNSWCHMFNVWQPESSRAQSLVLRNDKLWLFGGTKNILYRVNLAGRDHRWKKIEITGGPSARCYHSAVIHSDKMFILGGQGKKVYRDFYSFDFASKIWTMLTLPSDFKAVVGLQAVVYQNFLVVYGGQRSKKSNCLWLYSFETQNWQHVDADNSFPSPRTHHSLCAHMETFYVFGGLGKSSDLNDMWSCTLKQVQCAEKIDINVPESFALPLDVLLYILSFVKVKNLGRLARTSKFFNGVCSNELLWKQLYQKHYGICNNEVLASLPDNYWKSKYKSCWQSKWLPDSFAIMDSWCHGCGCNVADLFVMGSGGIGKTSFIVQFVKYTDSTRHNFSKLWTSKDKDLYYHVQITECSSPREHETKFYHYFKRAHGFIVMYDITSKESFTLVSELIVEVLQVKATDCFPGIIVGTKQDLKHQRQVSFQEGLDLAKLYNCPFLETSSKTRYNIDEAFEAALTVVVRKWVDDMRKHKPQPVTATQQAAVPKTKKEQDCILM